MSNIREEILEFIENNAIEEKWFDFTHPADIAEALEGLERDELCVL